MAARGAGGGGPWGGSSRAGRDSRRACSTNAGPARAWSARGEPLASGGPGERKASGRAGLAPSESPRRVSGTLALGLHGRGGRGGCGGCGGCGPRSRLGGLGRCGTPDGRPGRPGLGGLGGLGGSGRLVASGILRPRLVRRRCSGVLRPRLVRRRCCGVLRARLVRRRSRGVLPVLFGRTFQATLEPHRGVRGADRKPMRSRVPYGCSQRAWCRVSPRRRAPDRSRSWSWRQRPLRWPAQPGGNACDPGTSAGTPDRRSTSAGGSAIPASAVRAPPGRGRSTRTRRSGTPPPRAEPQTRRPTTARCVRRATRLSAALTNAPSSWRPGCAPRSVAAPQERSVRAEPCHQPDDGPSSGERRIVQAFDGQP